MEVDMVKPERFSATDGESSRIKSDPGNASHLTSGGPHTAANNQGGSQSRAWSPSPQPHDLLLAPRQDARYGATAAHSHVSQANHEPGQHDLAHPGFPHLLPNAEPYDEREQEAIRNLLDVPDVDIPVWDRERQPVALQKKLMAHQQVGLTWLINQEESTHKGGILADDMGLGKTIQALALILCRPPVDGTRKTTLIVVPTALLRQWEREIEDKVKPNHKLKTVIFHGAKKRNLTVARLLSHDIVLTTYGTLAHEYKQIYEQRKTAAAVLLAPHAIFHRIILDEAHNVKNRNSLSSKAVDRLHSTYRLCMTGTPLMNRLDELYPLIRFLRIEPYRQWENFRRNLSSIKGGETRALKQLHVLLGRTLLRRTEKTIVDGQPIFTLPDLTVQTVQAEFDEDQSEYYQALEKHSQLRMNRYLREGTVLRNYWYILLLILRLRQCCCHPHLIKDHTIPEGVNMTSEEMTDLACTLKRPVVDQIKRQKTFECPMCGETTEYPIIIYPCGHHICGACITNMAPVAESGMDFFESDRDDPVLGACPTEGCNEFIDSKLVICYNNFREVHLSHDDKGDRALGKKEEEELEDDDDADKNGNLKDFVVSDDHESDNEDEVESGDASLSTSEPDAKRTEDSSGAKLEESSRSDSRVEHSPERCLVPTAAVSESDADDSDDSLPPIDSIFSQIRKKVETKTSPKAPLTGLSATRQNKRNNLLRSLTKTELKRAMKHDPDSESEATNEDISVVSRQKRKRRLGQGIARPQKRSRKGKGRRTELTLSALKSNLSSAAAKERYFNGLRRDWESSAKIDKAMELLAMIRRDFPNEKTLVFSQFTSFLDLMEIPISDDGYNYRRYDGSMPNGDRDAAIDDFMKKPEVKIMLVSLRCGNAGLNLYAATRVIMLDPFWNPSVEDQAIKRAHRLGQTKPVVAYRILVEETVEDRILLLQEKKRQLVNDVLNAEARKGLSRLSVSELAGLFGINWRR
ncbi:hypothetical protein F5B22DRAFT_284236 [Xylaria bambusicola]|uniref:uncharacterized protein n=1 Tax=Xylaria bambusicola TaxID=326684 RepID=UPI002008D7E5|nr:uncharacterized protein F5B22DRAFT_284236 [Xylaria bambusicola]KAI0513038.1 hypothetical protein F5B22DRAFT_284236 [Xylaria bambusicola]